MRMLEITSSFFYQIPTTRYCMINILKAFLQRNERKANRISKFDCEHPNAGHYGAYHLE
jgi:hypothetical protein